MKLYLLFVLTTKLYNGSPQCVGAFSTLEKAKAFAEDITFSVTWEEHPTFYEGRVSNNHNSIHDWIISMCSLDTVNELTTGWLKSSWG